MSGWYPWCCHNVLWGSICALAYPAVHSLPSTLTFLVPSLVPLALTTRLQVCPPSKYGPIAGWIWFLAAAATLFAISAYPETLDSTSVTASLDPSPASVTSVFMYSPPLSLAVS
jgi:hypothetical protein